MAKDWNKIIIDKSKKAVREYMKVLEAPILFDDIDNTMGKTALSTKLETFMGAKSAISNILERDYKQQEWAKEAINNLIDSGENSVMGLINSLDQEVYVKDGIGKNANDVRNSIKSKDTALTDAFKMINAIDDLRDIVGEDQVVFDGDKTISGYAEKYTDKFTKMGTKAGYREDIDAVVIDPNGTVGEIIVISDLRIALPKCPTRKNIDNYNRTRKDEYKDYPDRVFRRGTIPRGLTKKNAKGYESFIEEQYMFKRNGYWFWNNHEPVYITGAHWFMLNHYRTGAENKGFYGYDDSQRKYFIFLEACRVDSRCMGSILVKIRRFGATDTSMAYSLCQGITARDKILGMTSKTDADAKGNFIRLAWAFSKLPFYFKPVCVSEKPKGKLEFSAPASRSRNDDSIDGSLNTYMNYMATKVDSYDGTAQYVYIADEFSKWKKDRGSTLIHYDMLSKALTKGTRKTGQAIILSTVEDITGADAINDAEHAKAGDNYKQLYKDSNVNNRNEITGETNSGLYSLFISCYEKYEGLMDLWGNPITEDPEHPTKTNDGQITSFGIKTRIEADAAKKEGNTRSLYSFYRMTPRFVEDAFRIPEGSCMFNEANIIDQMTHIDNIGDRCRIGNFEWDGCTDGGKVRFVDDANGRFRISAMLDNEAANNVYKKGDHWYPGNKGQGAFGVDPYKVDKAADGKGSKGACHGFVKENMMGLPDRIFFLEYLSRPDTRDVFEEDMIKCFVFHGMPALIESNVDSLLKTMHRRGYRKFALNRTDVPYAKLSPQEKTYGGVPSNSQATLQLHAQELERYIEEELGEHYDGYNTKVWCDMAFSKTLLDWLTFDISDRTKHDATVSSSLAIVGALRTVYKKRINKEEVGNRFATAFRKYDNSGDVGCRLN